MAGTKIRQSIGHVRCARAVTRSARSRGTCLSTCPLHAVEVNNIPPASSLIGMQQLYAATPDGLTRRTFNASSGSSAGVSAMRAAHPQEPGAVAPAGEPTSGFPAL